MSLLNCSLLGVRNW